MSNYFNFVVQMPYFPKQFTRILCFQGGDDFTVKVWDYQNKKCIQSMEGHTNNVTVVGFHPSLPIIISGSEDATVRIWHADTFRLEKTLNYGFERVW